MLWTANARIKEAVDLRVVDAVIGVLDETTRGVGVLAKRLTWEFSCMTWWYLARALHLLMAFLITGG